MLDNANPISWEVRRNSNALLWDESSSFCVWDRTERRVKKHEKKIGKRDFID